MRGRNIAGIIIIFIGLSMLFRFAFFNILVALLIIWIGIKMMGRRSWKFEDYKSVVSAGEVDKVFIFSPVNKAVKSENFKGGRVTLIFSGGELDLSASSTNQKEVDLEITTIFAGLKVIVPKDWKVISKESNVLGGIDDRTKGEGKVILRLKGSAIFGGMEIVNS